ncbi:MAG: hypothetical protein WD872_03500 [Pirellulaceae bacterium]
MNLHDSASPRTTSSMPQEPVTIRNTDLPPADDRPQPLRFRVVDLLVATTLAAMLLALFRALGIWGAALSFGAALIFTLIIYPRMYPGRREQQALMFDFVWGLAMPLVCLVYDPVVFKDGDLRPPIDFVDWAGPPLLSARLRDRAFLAYPVLLWQLMALAIVLVVGRLQGQWAAIVAGMLFVGSASAALIGIVLLPFSTLGLVVVIGILGYTPLLTAYSYGRRVRQLWWQADPAQERSNRWGWALLGMTLAAGIPAFAGLTLLVLLRGWDALPINLLNYFT